jgi:hypothetical protein
VSFLDKEGETERTRRRHRIWGAGEGGCCLLEVFAAATCLAGLVLIPLLMR